MAENHSDPTLPMRDKANQYPGVVEGESCSQASFKKGKKAFFYAGPQGGRYKAMFKLKDSIPEAEALAEGDSTAYEVGKFGWVTARFSSDDPMPEERWLRWLDESYQQTSGSKKKKS